jgi:ferredoxin
MAYGLRPEGLADFLRAICSGREVFAVEPQDGHFHLVRSPEWMADRHVLGAFRPIEPLKSLVFRPREFLGALAEGEKRRATKERIVVGVKNCDLSSLRIHDHVFLRTEPVDPAYAEARQKTILVACDCTDARETCFCTAVNEQPHAREGFDINLSPTPAGIVVESGSERGAALLRQVRPALEPAGEALLKARDVQRATLHQKVAALAARKGLRAGLDLRGAVRKSQEAGLWDEFAERCVECGACNFVCCTCHCFLLADGRGRDGAPSRTKQWDACLYKNFAREGGGANPRKHRAERLFNRFEKKFDFFPQTLGTYACDGCGRCVEACTGEIDIRDVLKRATDAL